MLPGIPIKKRIMIQSGSFKFSGKTAIVTGAGQGIGYEICRQLAQNGATVILNDIEPVLAENAARAIREEGGSCFSFPGDSGNRKVVESLVAFAISQSGTLDIAIANAGITLFGDFLDFSEESFQRVVNVNLGGTFFLAQAAAHQMKKQLTGGSILFTSSVTGHVAHRGLAVYGMTKAGIEMLAKCLVIELSSYGININTVVPGATLTERTTEDPDYEKTWASVIPNGRVARSADIAKAALFLVSDDAKHINGQSLVVDGGVTSISVSPF